MSTTILAEKVKSFIEFRAEAKREALTKAIDKDRKNLVDADPTVKAAFEDDAKQKLAKEAAAFQINCWLSDAASRAKQIQMITHAPKYTHGDASGNGVYLKSNPSRDSGSLLLSTASLDSKKIDIIGNAAALAIGALLQLSDDAETLLDQLSRGEAEALEPYAKDRGQLEDWIDAFSQALEPKELSSHKLSKQLYFPISEHGYHLLSPLYATTLSQVVFEKIVDNRYSDENKEVRKLRREGKYSDRTVVSYPRVAVQTFGGSNQQNISKLNATRGGRSFLFSTQPPRWRSISAPPGGSKNSFWRAYEHRVWVIVKALRVYLEKIEHRDSTLRLREIRSNYVDDLVSELLQFSTEIQNMGSHAGWSEHSKLPLSEQYWLDPHREDQHFQAMRVSKDWIDEICERFSSWLNHQLNKSKKLLFADVEYREWKAVMVEALKRDLRSMVE